MFADRSSSKAAQVIARATAGVVEALEQRTLFSAGDLDLTFGNDGIVLNPADLHFDLLHDVAVQSDGKIVAVGSAKGPDGREQLLLIRFDANGTPDNSFGTAGRVVTDVGAGPEEGQELAIQSDGKIVVAGSIGPELAVLRYRSNGTLDSTFNGDGIATIAQVEEGRGVAIQDDGRIVVSGVKKNDLFIVRLNANGQLDSSFGGDGVVETGIRSFMAGDVAVQDNGEILALGASAVRRLSSTGATLATYQIEMNASSESLQEIAVQQDGKIVLSGSARFDDFENWNVNAALVRLNANGQLDDTFGDGGIVRARGRYDNLALLADGDLLVTGASRPAGGTSVAGTARYNGDGTLDETYGNDGLAVYASGSGIAIASDGKIVVVANRRFDDTVSSIVIKRLTNDGDADTSFAGDGTYIESPRAAAAHDVLVLSNGKTLVAGSTLGIDSGRDFWIARFDVNGSLDQSFGDGGVRSLDLGFEDIAQTVALQSDGKIIAAGFAGHDFALVRLTAAGQLDESFGDDGFVLTPVGAYGRIQDIVVDASDNIFAVGIAKGDEPAAPNDDYVLAKYNAGGTLVNGFGDGGIVRTEIAAEVTDIGPKAIVLDTQGRILVAGTIEGGEETALDIAVLRYLPNGSLDNGFDNNGINRINMRDRVEEVTAPSNDLGFGLIVQDSGRIVVAGVTDNQLLLLGLEDDGSLDDSFGDDGKVIAAVAAGDEALIAGADLAEQADGKIVMAGSVGRARQDFFTARFTAEGQLDTSFAQDGIVITDIDGNDLTQSAQLEALHAVAVGPDGKIVVAGVSESRAALVRYHGDATSNPPPPGPGDSADLVIRGTAGDDEIVIRRDGDRLIVEVNGVTEIHDLADVRDIIVNGRAGADAITVAKGVSIGATLNGGKGADTLKGGGGDDTLNGNTGKDELLGRAGDDALVGGKANDTLVGGKGADTLTGNTGRDDLFGNSGADTFFAVDSIVDRLFGGKGDDSADADIDDVLASIEATWA